jgi:hypothetical protein
MNVSLQTRPATTPTAGRRIEDVARRLATYCRERDWSGYDPYDALNSRLFEQLPFLDSRWPRIALTQALKRSPVNIRPVVMVPATQNPKGLGLFLQAMLKCPDLLGGDTPGVARSLVDRLIVLRSTGPVEWCWGYSFPWQTRTQVVPRGTPNLVCTTFVAEALLDAYESLGDTRCLEMASSAAGYIVRQLYREDGDSAGFCYPLPTMSHTIHNANLLAAALLCRVWAHTGDDTLLAPALRAAHYSAGRQRPDGSWPYGEGPTQGWVDNFHTGYNLMGLRQIRRLLRSTDFDTAIESGLAFYRQHFLTPEGAPRYFHDRTYPIDIHAAAQSIITLSVFGSEYSSLVPLAATVTDWTLRNMWDERGFFYYRVLRYATIRTSYMRWSQAWMLVALTTFLAAGKQS